VSDKPKTNKFEILTPQGFEETGKPKKMKFVKKTECDRCGNCCSGSTPSLYKEDLDMFRSGVLSFDNTFTIRVGEIFSVPGDQETYRAFVELIKIKPKEGNEVCTFYSEDKGCAIYANRPSQCADYACWEMNDAMTGLEGKALKRKDLFGDIELLSDLIARHEELCSYERLSDELEKASAGDEAAAADIADMLDYDSFVRDYVTEKFNIPATALDLIFGKPMVGRIKEFGLRVEKEGDEFVLLPLKKEDRPNS